MKTYQISIMCLSLAFSAVAFGRDKLVTVTGSDAQAMYRILKDKPQNSGDGVMQKTGSLTCVEKGMKAPFTYECGSLNGEIAKKIYTQYMSKIPRSNDGDGLVDRNGDLSCFEKGAKAPFSYTCEISTPSLSKTQKAFDDHLGSLNTSDQ